MYKSRQPKDCEPPISLAQDTVTTNTVTTGYFGDLAVGPATGSTAVAGLIDSLDFWVGTE
jgi:hypothetical protein